MLRARMTGAAIITLGCSAQAEVQTATPLVLRLPPLRVAVVFFLAHQESLADGPQVVK